MRRGLIREDRAASCYFRSSVKPPYRKALLQITEQCNLHCAHCFVSAGKYGNEMSIEFIRDIVIPQLKQCRVISVTLTGGEPFIHQEIIEIVRLLREAGMRIGICTNGTLINLEQMEFLAKLGNAHLNVSLDGFSPESHGRFRGSKASFAQTIKIIQQLSQFRLLQGLLVTPNTLAKTGEYAEICDFAIQNGAAYVLMNPLSRMGRGVRSKDRLGSPNEAMEEIRRITTPLSRDIQVVYIRFPNEQLPLASCEAGNIVYIFADGKVAICPYLVFAARTPDSKHNPNEFITGNILSNSNIAEKLDDYKFTEKYLIGDNPNCRNCHLQSECGKGCPAAIIASGQRIEGVDREICPIISSDSGGSND